MTTPTFQALLMQEAATNALPFTEAFTGKTVAGLIAEGWGFAWTGDSEGTIVTETYGGSGGDGPFQANTLEQKLHPSSPTPSGGSYLITTTYAFVSNTFTITLPAHLEVYGLAFWFANRTQSGSMTFENATGDVQLYASLGGGSSIWYFSDQAKVMSTIGRLTKIKIWVSQWGQFAFDDLQLIGIEGYS